MARLLKSTDAAAIAARVQVERGATLYRIGEMKSQLAEAQFWSLENPCSVNSQWFHMVSKGVP